MMQMSTSSSFCGISSIFEVDILFILHYTKILKLFQFFFILFLVLPKGFEPPTYQFATGRSSPTELRKHIFFLLLRFLIWILDQQLWKHHHWYFGRNFGTGKNVLNLVRTSGFEPLTHSLAYYLQLSLPPEDVCSLDFLFTIQFSLIRCFPLSLYTFSFLSFARDYHLTGFPEFEKFYSESFPSGTPFFKINVTHWF